jgi:hypothetical protein
MVSVRRVTVALQGSGGGKYLSVLQTYSNFPNCLRAAAGEHAHIVKPVDSGSLSYNYKQPFSVMLLTVADSDGLFAFVDIRSYGKVRLKKIQEHSVNKN